MKYILPSPLSTQNSKKYLTRWLGQLCRCHLFLRDRHHPFSECQYQSISTLNTSNSLPPSSSIPSPFDHHSSSTSRLFLLDGPGGTGKKIVTKGIQGFLQLGNKNVIAVVTSAVAAQLLRGGWTAHYSFKIPIPCSESDTRNFPTEGQLTTNLTNVDLIILEEVVMAQRYWIDAVDRTIGDLIWNWRILEEKYCLPET